MRYIKKLLLLSCIILLSCTHREENLPPVLSEAESFMWEYPDSALSILQSVPQPSSLDEKAYATWCLLLVQACDKVYGKHLPDSLNVPSLEDLIQKSLAYFEDKNDLKRKAQAYYYKGQLLEDKDKSPEAVSFYLKSRHIMEKLEEPLFNYLICQSLGNIYRRQSLDKESLQQLQDAYQYALEAQNGERVSYALSEIGRTFIAIHRFDSALHYFDRSLINACQMGDLRLQGMAMGELGVVYRELGQNDSSLFYIRNELSIINESKSFCYLPQAYFKLGGTFMRLGEIDSAKIYFAKSLRTDNLYTLKSAYNVLYNIEVMRGNYREAIKYNERYLIYADSLSRIHHARKLSEIQAKYDYQKLRNANNELIVSKTKQELIGLATIVFLLGLALVYQYRLLRKGRVLAAAQKEIWICGERIKENEEQIRKNEQLIFSLWGQQLNADKLALNNRSLQEENKQLQDYIDQYLISPSQKIKLNEQIPYFDLLKNLEKCPSYIEEKDWKAIMDWTDLQYNQFMVRLKHDFPYFTILDRQYCCLIKMGLSNYQISRFMASSPDSVTKQKQRIKQRIKQKSLMPISGYFSLDEYIANY